jgi:cytochrome c553
MKNTMTNIKNKIAIALVLIVVVMAFQNCGEFAPQKGSADGSSTTINIPIEGLDNAPISAAEYEERKVRARGVFLEYCASCHNPGSGVTSPIADILNLDALVSGGFAVIGSPQTSKVYTVLIDEIEPRNGNKMDASDRDIIRDWLIGPIESDVLVASGGNGNVDTTIPATYANVNSRIIAPLCASCHNGTNGRSDLRTYAGLTANMRITPGNVNTSEVWRRIIIPSAQVDDDFMPRNGAPLTVTQKSLLQRWINNGAPMQ